MNEKTMHVAQGNGWTVPDTLEGPEPIPLTDGRSFGEDRGRLSTRELVSRILHTGSRLVSKEIELARAEAKADLEAELGMVKMLAVAAVGALLGLNLLLVAVVFALTHWVPGWLAALVLGGVILAVSAIVGYVGWQRRVTKPLAVTRKTVTEDLQWVKERLA